MKTAPYLSRTEDILAICCFLVNTANAILTFLTSLNVAIPNAAALPFAILNGVLPALVIIIGTIFERRLMKKVRKYLDVRQNKVISISPKNHPQDDHSDDLHPVTEKVILETIRDLDLSPAERQEYAKAIMEEINAEAHERAKGAPAEVTIVDKDTHKPIDIKVVKSKNVKRIETHPDFIWTISISHLALNLIFDSVV